MEKRIYTLIISLCLGINLIAQLPTFGWAKQAGVSTPDMAYEVAVDNMGNSYNTGYFRGTVDFDPGPGIFTLNAGSSNAIYVQKLTPAGNLVWAVMMNGTGFDQGRGIVVDNSGNVYVTGAFQTTCDFDPGAGVFNMTAVGGSDVFILKLDPAGNFLWAQSIGTSYGNEWGNSIDLDASNNAYVTGPQGTSSGDVFIRKINAAGTTVWTKNLVSASSIEFNALRVTPTGSVAIVGSFSGTVDIDPSPGTYTLTANFRDVCVLKLDSAGNFLWANKVGGNSNDEAWGVDIDASGNIYTTGYFGNGADFDPGPGSFPITSAGGTDVFIQKLDAAGNFVWAKSLGGTGGEQGYDIFVDAGGYVFTTGYFGVSTGVTTSDFDPGTGTAYISTIGQYDVFVSKLDPAGNYVWAFNIGGADDEYGYSVAVDAANIYIVGSFISTVDFDGGIGTYAMTSSGGSNEDIFIARYGNCSGAPSQPGSINGITNMCQGNTNTYSVSPVSGATSYNWSLPGGWSGTSIINTISATPGASGGNISVTANNGCGSSSTSVLSITVNPNPTITVNSGSICSGSSFTMIPGGASTYTFSSGSAIVSPTTNTSYSVSGTSTAGCVSSLSAISDVTVVSNPTANAGSSQTITCLSPSVTLNGSGVSTYTWSGPGIVSGGNSASAIVNIAGTYSLVGSTGGCNSNTAIVSVSANTLAPVVSANTSNSIICGPPFQQTATLTASGASTYSWNTSSTTASISVSPGITTTYTVIGTAANGCTNTATFTQTVSACTGINEAQLTNDAFRIYPNPTNSLITINGTKGIGLEIFNSFGELIHKTEMISEKTEIDLSEQAPGIYFIRVGSIIKKLIKQ